MPDTPLSALKNLSPRSAAALRGLGIHTLEAAASLSNEELASIPGCGPSSVKRIRDWQAGLPEASSRAVVRGPDRRDLFDLFKMRVASGLEPEEALRMARLDLETFQEEVAPDV
jgi:hypothetical protein